MNEFQLLTEALTQRGHEEALAQRMAARALLGRAEMFETLEPKEQQQAVTDFVASQLEAA